MERLQKIIAAAGLASRRKAEELIVAGAVTVNGQLVTQLGTQVDPQRDHIKVHGKLINPKLDRQEKLYLLLNKPAGFLSSRSDPRQRPLVIDLLGPYRDKVHPVGRLDLQSEGLLLLTNDGAFTQLIAHASKQVPKVYEVKVKGKPGHQQILQLQRGVILEGTRTAPARIEMIEESATNAWYRVTLFEGRNQQIRRMFDSIGHSVLKLRRVAIGFLDHESLAPGQFRHLLPAEVKRFFQYRAPASPSQSSRSRKRPESPA